MSKKCDWNVRLANGASEIVRAASKRMAQAEAALVAYEKKSAVMKVLKKGSTRNGSKSRNPNRPMPFPKGYQERVRSWHRPQATWRETESW